MKGTREDEGGAMVVPMLDPEIVERSRLLQQLRWGSKRIARELGVARNSARRCLRGGAAAEVQARPMRGRSTPIRRRWRAQRPIRVAAIGSGVDEPWLAAVHDRLAGAGLEVVTVSVTDDPAAHAWPTFVDAGEPGPVAALYRVDEFPTYFIVDRDGTLACARCQHEEADRVLARLFPGR